MSKRIAIVGAGAIGSSIAADLTRAGESVAVFDHWPAHVEAMKADGLCVTRPDGVIRTPVEAYHLCEAAELHDGFDVVLFAAKSQDTRWLAAFIEPYLRPDGVLVGVQNGMNDGALAEVVGAERVVGCVVELSAEVFTPGVVQRNTDSRSTWFALGELDGAFTPRLRELEALMSHVGRVSPTDNIEGAKWTKLVNSSMILGPFGILGLQSYQAVQIPEVCALCAQIGLESMRVGAASGYRLEAIFGRSAEAFDVPDEEVVDMLLHALVHDLGASTRNARGVVLQDFLKGRRTEVAFLNGVVSRHGRERGIPTPANDAVVEVARRIERGERTHGRDNLALLQLSADGHPDSPESAPAPSPAARGGP
jgi:2-dehydropantoate 2-reductase